MNNQEKRIEIGRFLLDIAKLTFAAIAFVLLPESVKTEGLYAGFSSFLILSIMGFVLIFSKPKK